jgi:hypothetical protein
MPLTEGAAVAAFAMAVISWYGMLRSGIDLLHKDKTCFKRFGSELVEIDNIMVNQCERLDDWQEKWMVYDEDISDSLFAHFWDESPESDNGVVNPNNRVVKIKKAWRTVQVLTDEAEKNLIALTGPLLRGKPEEFKNLSFLAKVRFVMTKKNDIVNLVGKLKEHVDILDGKANRYWINECANKPGRRHDTSKTYVHQIGIAFLLVELSMQTLNASRAFHQSCEESVRDALLLELELNSFDAEVATSHPKAISVSASKGSLKHSVLAKQKATNQHLRRVRVEQFAGTKTPQNLLVSFDVAFAWILIQRKSAKARFQVTEDITFEVTESKRFYPHAPFPRLREIIETAPAQNLNLLRAGVKSNFLVELAESALLFLGTPWLTNLCSCNLCGRVVDRELTCALRIGNGHMNTCAFRDQPNQSNPHNRVLLRHLGILLIEIVTRTLISEIDQENGSITKLYFRDGVNPFGRRQTLEESLTKVHAASRSESLRRAVEYCLQSTLTLDQATAPDYFASHLKYTLKEFNREVLLP